MADWLRRQGVNVLGEEVGARTLGELRKMDILAEISGKLFNLESKIRSAERPLLQKAKDIAMEHFGARLVGKNAPKELLNQFIRKIETIVIKH